MRPRASSFFRPFERQPPDHRVVAEAGADAVDGVLGLRGAAVDEVGGIGLIGGDQRARADADQPEARAVGFALEQIARGGEDAAGELGGRVKRARPRANFEIRGLEF